jgi:hypothetical protein
MAALQRPYHDMIITFVKTVKRITFHISSEAWKLLIQCQEPVDSTGLFHSTGPHCVCPEHLIKILKIVCEI